MTAAEPLTAEQFADGCGFTYRGVAVCENEDGDRVFAYGHVPPGEFVKVVRDYVRDQAGYAEKVPKAAVRHVWAINDPARAGLRNYDGWYVFWADGNGDPYPADTPGVFPLTVVDR